LRRVRRGYDTDPRRRLTDAAGLVNKTPAEFSKAVEDGTDVPPTVLNDSLRANPPGDPVLAPAWKRSIMRSEPLPDQRAEKMYPIS
jgi:hypothetical protein